MCSERETKPSTMNHLILQGAVRECENVTISLFDGGLIGLGGGWLH